MTSREFYACVQDTLSPACATFGRRANKGTTVLWLLETASGTIVYEVCKGVKNPYDPILGGRFNVRCDLVREPDPKARRIESGISFTRYFDDDDLQAMRELRDRVLNAILSQVPAAETDRRMLETFGPTLRLEMGSQVLRNQPPRLPYRDRGDVEAWAQFLAARLQKTISGIERDAALRS